MWGVEKAGLVRALGRTCLTPVCIRCPAEHNWRQSKSWEKHRGSFLQTERTDEIWFIAPSVISSENKQLSNVNEENFSHKTNNQFLNLTKNLLLPEPKKKTAAENCNDTENKNNKLTV